jgi:predicted MFS family arabinose efflux permease
MSARPNVAPPIGPLLGGIIAARLGWNYIFWFLCGLSGICLVTIILSLPETARCIVGNGSISPPRIIYKTWLPVLLRQRQVEDNPAEVPERRRRTLRDLPNPVRSLKVLLEKDSLIILVCNGIFYATYCCLQASLSSLFIQLYGYRELQAGLIYIPFGIGCLIASFLSGLSIFSSLLYSVPPLTIPITHLKSNRKTLGSGLRTRRQSPKYET